MNETRSFHGQIFCRAPKCLRAAQFGYTVEYSTGNLMTASSNVGVSLLTLLALDDLTLQTMSNHLLSFLLKNA